MSTYNIAVIGCGYIGAALVKEILRVIPDCKILILDQHEINKFEHLDNVIFKKCDIRDSTQVNNNLSKGIDTVYLKAALLGTPSKSTNYDFSKEYIDINILGVENVLKACVLHSIPKIIFDSSMSVYGDEQEANPALEKLESSPMNYYGFSKTVAENLLYLFNEKYFFLKISILRYSRVRSTKSEDIIYNFINCIKHNNPITIYGDPNKVLDFVDINDVLKVNIFLLKNELPFNIYNLTSGTAMTVIEIARYIIRQFNLDDYPIEFRDSQVDFEISNLHMDMSNSKQELNFEPDYSLKMMIKETISAMENKI